MMGRRSVERGPQDPIKPFRFTVVRVNGLLGLGRPLVGRWAVLTAGYRDSRMGLTRQGRRSAAVRSLGKSLDYVEGTPVSLFGEDQ
jgi:hypothetical protein